ncbi:MAG: polyprenyl synthetase family protein [Eubacterium sp.]|nr:polyprenyl synthetase family protein [Eubacterium sp.]
MAAKAKTTKKSGAKENPSKLDEVKSYIENIVIGLLPEPDGMSDPVANAMIYAVKAGGKRVRPLLMYLTYKAFSADSAPHDKAIEYFMAALEMIHTYSLIHDDLPALDNDDMRRGNPTVHKAFGEDVAILAGDGLLNYAYETAAKSFICCPGDIDVEKAVFILASKPGLYGMLGGQTVDVVLTGKRPTAEQLSYIYSNKTAALLECAMTIGGTLAGVSGENLDKLQNAAYYIGMAFQVQDDILDVTGNAEELGKDVSQDKKNGKITFVTIYGIEKAKEYVKQASLLAIKLVDEAYATIKATPETDEYITMLKNLITKMITRKN